MEINRKTEEKKMSMNKNIARLAVTAGLTAALSFGGVMAPVTMAFATDATANGSVTISNVEGNVTEFKGYQIFNADVADGTASNITWANEAVQNAVEGVIRTEDTSYAGMTAQDAAEWITQRVTETGKNTRVDSNSVAYKIADAVDGLAPNATTNGKTVSGLAHGYWLFVTDESTLGTGQNEGKNTGTSPIFAVVGDAPVTVTEKTSIPTVDKEILKGGAYAAAKEAKSSDRQFNQFNNCGDSQIGQEVSYRLTGTVADNIASYAEYRYEFQDTLSKGLVVTKGEDGTTPKDLHVYIVNDRVMSEVKSGFEATVVPAQDTAKNSELLTVKFGNLKDVKDRNDDVIAVDKDSEVVVTYKAQLTSDASYDATGNKNTVKLVYSNNPMAEGTGTSVEKTVTDHVFCLDVTKVDKDHPDTKLEAGFKVQVVKNDDRASEGKWLASDGSLVDTEDKAHEFMTNSSGEIRIPGLDAGKYGIVETTTPSCYNTIKPFWIEITPEYDPTTGELIGLQASDNSDFVEASFDGDASIPVTIQNKKGSGLPLTGLNGVTFTWIAGGAVLCIGVAHLIRSRKQAEESEQE